MRVRRLLSKTKSVLVTCVKSVQKATKFAHFHVAHRPHVHLTKKFDWYRRWHEYEYHSHVHVSVLVPYTFIVFAAVLFVYRPAFAADLSTLWDFSNDADYSYNDATIETGDGYARLKAQNYATDANTAALYHFDEVNGSTITDSSANANNGTVLSAGMFVAGQLNNALQLDGDEDFAEVPDSPSLRLSGQHTLEAWTRFDDGFDVNASQDAGIFDKGSYRLYYNSSTGKINYELENAAANTWTRQAGLDANGSWDQDGKTIVRSSAASGSDVYVGLGLGLGDAEVWHWDGSAWRQVAGDDVNNSWASQTFEDVHSLFLSGSLLYAGIGSGTGDAEVWRCDVSTDCLSWTKIGGDGINSGWQINTFEGVFALTAFGGNLYAGLGSSANDAEVWSWNGTAWTKIGGDSLNSGWTTNFEAVRSLTNDGTNLYAGIGDTAADAEVWSWNGTTWTRIGGDGVNTSWAVADNIEYVASLEFFGGNLYAGTASSTGDADVWRWNGTTWTKIGGDGLNSGWPASAYELVASLANDGTNLYAGLANGNGDGEVWRWNGTAWTKIGGDGANASWPTNFGDGVYAMSYSGSTLYTGLYDSAGDGQMWTWNGSSWTRIGGGYVNESWGFFGMQSVESSANFDSKLYVGTGVSLAGAAMVWEYNGSTWRVIGGQGVRGSWAPDTFENVFTLQSYNGELYAGLGTGANDAEVWRYNGTSWTQVGGDSLNGGWTTNYEGVYSLTPYNGVLYAGLGASANDAEVWGYNGTSWTKVGGDSLNSGWTTNFETVYAMTVYQNQLYAGLGASTGDAEVWRFNGTSWTRVGGDGVNGSWNTNYEEVYAMRIYNGQLVAGIGSGTGDAELWTFDGTAWTQIGGDDVNGSWPDGTYERVRAMAVYNGALFVGIGESTGDGEVWRWNGTSWTKIGGGGLNSGWTTTIENVSTLIDYRGKLYAGTGNTSNADAFVWSYGNNAYLSSAQTVQDDQWHHIAATYDGTTMRIYVDGQLDASANIALTMATSNLPLKIGSTYGSGGRGEAQGYFKGQIDEARISTVARNTFTTRPYSTAPQAISLSAPSFTAGIESFQGFSSVETLNGGSIRYRVSVDGGDSWLYWDGSIWNESESLTETSLASEVNTNILTLPVTFDGLVWQAVLLSDGNQRVTLNSVTVEADQDAVAPQTNASAITANKSNGGASLASNAWTNGSSPYFSWTAGADSGSGLLGYCLYLGQDNSADPVTTKGLLGTSPIATGGSCQYIVSGTELDLAVNGALSTPLTTSTSPYYLLVSAVDRAGNVFPSTAAFQFRFDNTLPTNPGFISAPSGFVNNKEVTMTWPTSGGQAAADAASGIAGLQYRIGSGTWYGDVHDGTGSTSDLLVNDGTYTTIPTPDFDDLIEGINNVTFRTWDNAGNVTTSYVSAAIKVNTNGSPSAPQNLNVTPPSSSTNNFSFSWNSPETFVGSESLLNYCYTFNQLPSLSTCTYSGTGITGLSAGPYATQPGVNTMYVVARDESGNINYANFASVNFTANTSAPGIPANMDIVDVSIKATSKWRLAITWDAPTDDGDGIASYRVFRSTDGTNFALVGSSTSTTYIDAGLSQQDYYYRVTACDSTSNCSANSSMVDLYPTGRFTEPATLLGEPEASNITTKRAVITWTTDRVSDSKIAIGTQSGQYGAAEIGNSDQVAVHQIDLDNLAAGTTYYYVARWTDSDGNTGTSQEYTFTTQPAPVIKEIATTKVTLSEAIVSFTSQGASRVNLYFGPTESFGGLRSINTSSTESTYNLDMTGLADGTKYFYQLSSFDSEGTEYKGNIFSFTTPQRPRINNLRFEPIEGEPTSTQSVTWTTNVPSTSTVTYGKTGTGGIDIQNSELKTDHRIVIAGLEDDSQYFLVAQSRDGNGNLAVSDTQTFRTALDTRPPTVSDVTIEASIRGTGSEARGQVIVSWRTDEPATSQVAYAEGSAATVFNNRTSEDTQLTTEHIVVLSNLPTSKVYSIQPVSYDKARNIGVGEPQPSIIGRASESVLTIILNALQRVFGV